MGAPYRDRAATPDGAQPPAASSRQHGIPSAFTPGPWFAYHRGAPRTICADVSRDGAKFLERIAWVKDTADGFANARLIAAAPELYAACAEYLRAFDEGTGTVYVEPLIRAALAKARGEA